MIHRQWDHDLKILIDAMEKYQWKEDSPPRGAIVFPGWTLGKPDGWPVGADIAYSGGALIEIAKKLPLRLLGKLFK